MDEIKLYQAFEMVRLIRKSEAENLLEQYAASFNAFGDAIRHAFTKDKKESDFVKELRKNLKLKGKSEPIEMIQETAKDKYPFLFKKKAVRDNGDERNRH